MKTSTNIAVLGAMLAGLALAAPASAHPRLLGATPSANAPTPAPAEVRLRFSETLIAKYCAIAVTQRSGRPVPIGPTLLTPDHRQMVARLNSRLAPGAYRVTWRAVSTDTHRVGGSFGFVVR